MKGTEPDDAPAGRTPRIVKQLAPKLTVRPLTPGRFAALEDLFGDRGPAGRCWCMYWRIGSAYHRRAPAANRAALRELAGIGPPPGLLAYHGDLAVGWCQLTPRGALPWLDRARNLEPLDDVPVWSLSCFYVRKGWRKRGVTAALIAAAIDSARRAGAPALEAYPLDGDLTPSTSFTGYVSTVLQAGFEVVARRIPTRPIVRYQLRPPSRATGRRPRMPR